MLKERREAAAQVAADLFEAEAAIDAAIQAVSRLAAGMPLARQDAHLAAAIGQDALMAAIETNGLLVQARARIIATHGALKEAQTQAGLGNIKFSEHCPADAEGDGGQTRRRHLSIAT
jgi:hypothetical protein